MTHLTGSIGLTVVCETKWDETKWNETRWKSVVCEVEVCGLRGGDLWFAKGTFPFSLRVLGYSGRRISPPKDRFALRGMRDVFVPTYKV